MQFTQGDDNVTLGPMTCEDGFGNPIDLTGATLTTTIRGKAGAIVTIPNGSHTISNQSTNKGQFTINLTSTYSSACAEGSGKDVITEVVVGGSTIYFRLLPSGQDLTVYAAVPKV